MLSKNSVMGFLMLGVMLQPAYAAGGLNKHDHSIATYDYSVEIKTGEESGPGRSLAEELDKGLVGEMPVASAPSRMAPAAGTPASAPIAGTASIAVGSAAPDFQLARADGQVITLKDVLARGPALVLFVPGAANGSQQMQLLQKNRAQLQQLGIVPVAISGDPMDAIARSARSHGITYPVLSDTSRYVSQQYGVPNAPTLVSIDQSGRIAAVQSAASNGGFDLSAATLPLRPDNSAPQQAVLGQVPSVETARQPIAAMRDQAPVLQAPPGIQPLAPSEEMPESMAPMPPVPSPQATPGVMAPRVNYELPPSHPDFRKDAHKALAV